MFFKQIQLFHLSKAEPYALEKMQAQLEELAYTPCLPTMSQSIGWVSPIDDENEPLVKQVQSNLVFCLQVEEKIMPASVIRHELGDVIKQMEKSESRKLRQKEKMDLKDQVTLSMLPRAFSRFSKVYAYIDIQNSWLILGTANAKQTEYFMSLFKKTFSEELLPLDIQKPASIMTLWLKNQSYPTSFSIEKACVLQDPNQENRVIRCKEQNLFEDGIQALIKDGCEAVQLALNWQDRVNFVLTNNFTLTSIQFQDEIIAQVKEMEAETEQQRFFADVIIMSGVFSALLTELLALFDVNKRLSESAKAS